MKRDAMVVGLALALVLAAASQAPSSDLAAAARSLAENVLGSGAVTALTIADHASSILIRWESPTFTERGKLETLRENVAAEAQLATGSIMGRLLEVRRVRFSIRRGATLLAFGENNRTQGFALTFAGALGGGMYVTKGVTGQRSGGNASGSGGSAKD